MKVLWVTPIILPEMAKELNINNKGSGGWLGAMLPMLLERNEITEVHILCLGKEKKNKTFISGKAIYHYQYNYNSVFKDNAKIKNILDRYIKKINPDIIDIQGLEFHYAKYLSEYSEEYPVIGTVQGLTSKIYKNVTSGIKLLELIKYRTIKDYLLFDGLFERKYQYYKRGKSEVKALKNLKYVTGRTFWDKSQVFAVNPNAKYFTCKRNIRKIFYEHNWDSSSFSSKVIFVSQAHTAFKGFHILLKALSIVKINHPTVKVRVAGANIVKFDSFIGSLRMGTYGKFLLAEINRLGLENNIEFLGTLTSEEMVKELTKSSCYVMPSFIENSPNSLTEAMIVGVPSIAAFVGGTPDVIVHNYNGYLYNPYEPESLAYYLDKIFSDYNVSCDFNKRTVNNNVNDNRDNATELVNIYEAVINDYKENH